MAAFALHTNAADILVSPTGNDSCDGITKPVATLTMALRKVRETRRLKDSADTGNMTIHLQRGTYYIYEPVFVRPEDSGTKIIGDDDVVISGGVRVFGWKKEGKLWVADVPDFNGKPFDFRQLWINGRKADRARDVQNFEKMFRILSVDKAKQMIWVPKKAVEKVLHSPYTEMILHEMWCVANLRIKSITVQGDSAGISFHNPESRIQFEHPWPSPMVTEDGTHNSPFYLANAIELLDTEGEWYHDIRTGILYYYPRKDEDMTKAETIVPAIETLIQITGTLDNPVHDVSFCNIHFEHTTWMRPSYYGHVPLQAGMYLIDGYKLEPKMIRDHGNHKLDNQGWLGRAAAAVQIENTKGIDFKGCAFRHLGGSGLDYITGNMGGTADSCTFTDIAMNGYVAGSFSPTGLETHQPYNPQDKREVCTEQTISNSIFTDVTNEDWGCVAIAAGYVAGINICSNDISEISYTGISLGWGWTRTPNCMHDNRVYGNKIHHYAKHMYDTAGIYTLGAQQGTVISNNAVYGIYSPSYVHDPQHWFYLYTDEGSSGITIKDNYTESEKYLKNANGPGNIWENNGNKVRFK